MSRRRTKRLDDGGRQGVRWGERQSGLGWSKWFRREGNNRGEVNPKARAEETSKVSRRCTKVYTCRLMCEGMKACLRHFILSPPAVHTPWTAPQEAALVGEDPGLHWSPPRHLCSPRSQQRTSNEWWGLEESALFIFPHIGGVSAMTPEV